MKTMRSKNKPLPKPFRFVFFIIGIALVCLPNWIALRAGRPVEDPGEPTSLHSALMEVEKEPELELREWMYSFEAFDLVAMREEEVQLEDWMLDFSLMPQWAEVPEQSSQTHVLNLKPYSEEWFNEFLASGFQMSGNRHRQHWMLH
jgi:hypothetical protein